MFHTTVKEIGSLSGLSPDTISKRERFQSKTSQKRLRDIVMIINRLLPWCGTPLQAYAWFRSEPISSFGDLTAEGMVKRDISEVVLEYLDRIAEGVFA
ncbi:MAG: XRE family transcriptional regulator [Gammaproteobacteria bacterium]|nr:XRE family transcriptional regulator [Gammaproteobacteria bacterium]